MDYLPTSWRDIHLMSLDLAQKVLNTGFTPDMVVGVLRGGYIIARIFADVLGISDIGIVEVKFYKGIGERAERPVITQPLTLDVRGKNIMIIDDVVESGRTLQVVSEQIRLRGAREVRSGALFVKPKAIALPDYYIRETTAWILFPWEYGEFILELSKGKIPDKDSAAKILGSVGIEMDEELIEKLTNVLRKRLK